jgi:Zn-dependent alcohol dehydrogenase
VWKGTAFGGWKPKQDLPKLVNKVMLGELPIDKYVTHNLDGLDKVNQVVDLIETGECLKGVI